MSIGIPIFFLAILIAVSMVPVLVVALSFSFLLTRFYLVEDTLVIRCVSSTGSLLDPVLFVWAIAGLYIEHGCPSSFP